MKLGRIPLSDETEKNVRKIVTTLQEVLGEALASPKTVRHVGVDYTI